MNRELGKIAPLTLGERVPPHKGGCSDQKALSGGQKRIEPGIQAYNNDVESGGTKVKKE